MTKGKYFTAENRPTLEQCLKTEQPIEEKVFTALILSKVYEFYAYDVRIKANRYLLKNLAKNKGFPSWLHEYDS